MCPAGCGSKAVCHALFQHYLPLAVLLFLYFLKPGFNCSLEVLSPVLYLYAWVTALPGIHV